MAKILVAMSGGVDSSLAAAILLEQGHTVTGVTMHLWDEAQDARLAESLCCSQEMTDSARRVCAQLGIPYYVFNYQREFRRHVIGYFLDTYSNGLTPNPCLECNREIKFRALLERALALDFDYVATGHYARVRAPETPGGQYQLLRGIDVDKDQSYMLHMLGQADLRRLLFPVGELTKRQVRERASALGLASADRPESQDICFVPGGDYRNMLREERPDALRPGPIVDLAGRELGQHNGVPLYTIGQRRGLGLAAGEPLYVVALDAARNAVVVGPASALEQDTLRATRCTWVADVPPAEPTACFAQIRAHAEPVAATVTPDGHTAASVQFAEPQRAITPGQAVVFYDGERVLGGGRIAAEAA